MALPRCPSGEHDSFMSAQSTFTQLQASAVSASGRVRHWAFARGSVAIGLIALGVLGAAVVLAGLVAVGVLFSTTVIAPIVHSMGY